MALKARSKGTEKGKLADNTIRRQCGHHKQFFISLKKKLIAENPFGEMKDCNVKANRSPDYFVPQDDCRRIIEHALTSSGN